MNTLWLLLFMCSTVLGVISFLQLIVSIVSPKKRKNFKNSILIFAVCIILFFTSAICYSGDPVPADTSDVPDTTETIPTVLTTQESEPPQEQPFSDLDLIRAEGHPTYYGSTKVAHEIWDSAPKGKVIFADSFAKRSDNTIIYMWGYRQGENSEIIRDLQLVFYNSDDLRSIELDEALQIADEYLPHDIMNQWYEFSRSYALVPHDSKKGTCYVVTYHLTDSGKNSNEHPYSGTIDVILDVNTETNQVYSLSIGFGTPKWMNFTEMNGYERVEWDFDFCRMQ